MKYSKSCAGCAQEYGCPSECPCDTCTEGQYAE